MMLALIILSLFAIGVMFLGFAKLRNIIMPVALGGVALAFYALISGQTFWNHYLMNMLQTDGNAAVLSGLVMLNGLALIPFYNVYEKRGQEEIADFLGLILFALVGSILMVSCSNYMTMFLGVEILSISMYILAGADRRKVKSNEASLKYFITGSFTSAILLFGIALLYAVSGSLNIDNSFSADGNLLAQMAYLFIFTGFALKIAIVPFHFWAPDVYEGTPTLFTAAMASLVKIASMGAFFRIIQMNAENMPDWIDAYFIMLILATLIFGNLFALKQQGVKRLLAYSGIVQAGFILMGFIQLKPGDDWAILYYFIAYVLASVVSFTVVHFVEEQSGSDDLNAFAGLYRSNPTLAVVMTIALISLAGGPFTSGFVAKIFMLNQAITHGYAALVVVAVICTILSVYYYYKIINAMFSGSADQKFSLSPLHSGMLILFSLVTLAAGIIPTYFVGLLK
ncbi:MAG: NADH-quinone oxidoreductase subunit N [Saprospiraceae bacterium]|nr:NADH-quinone oxidoreductase subunit N [Saprospiraceae bacterium]